MRVTGLNVSPAFRLIFWRARRVLCCFCRFRLFSLAYGSGSFAPFPRGAGRDWGRNGLDKESGEDLGARAGARLQGLAPRTPDAWGGRGPVSASV